MIYRHGRKRTLLTAGTLLGGVCLFAAMASITYLHNWIYFKNPIWPISYVNPRFGIDWPGVESLAATDVNRPAWDVYKALFKPPVPGHDFADTRVSGYGFSAPILLPIAAWAVVVALVSLFLQWLRRTRWQAAQGNAAFSVLFVGAFLLFAGRVSPALWSARYNVELVAGMFALIAYLAGSLRAAWVAEGCAAFALVSNCVSLSWLSPPVGGLGVKATMEVAKHSPRERVAMPAAEWTIDGLVAAARERELGPDSVVVFSDDTTFPAVLWNETFSNRAVYVPGNLGIEPARQRIEDLGAKWLVTKEHGVLWQLAGGGAWEPVGLASRGYPTTAFRRRP